MKNIFAIIVCLLCFEAYAQSIKVQLKQVTTIEDAKKFAQENQNLEAQLISSIPEIENDEFAAKLSTAKLGDIFSDIDFTYKILFTTKIQAFRVSYIYLDGSKLSAKEIEKMRTKILEEYKNGNAFAILAKKYSMDNSKDGDLGWFSEGMMVPEFETAIKNHKQNDVFKVDVPDKKWYYVVLKTFNDKEVEELSILKIKSST
ncbi:peptidylprolyl isomerase [Flavobacterium sp. ZB4R12]|uniref:peptidylprolyl isomerase n=1 Tax=Flavobacterium sp. ZB4R12 TaxID=3398732 RepID=UPI003AAD5678